MQCLSMSLCALGAPALAFVSLAGTAEAAVAMQAQTSPAANRSTPNSFGFVKNEGQWHCDVLYHAAWGQQALTLTKDELLLRLDDLEKESPAPVLRIALGNHPMRVVEPPDRRSTPLHFLLGTGSASGVAAFDQLLLEEVAPGIDVRLRSESSGFYYDVEAQGGAALEELAIRFEGAEDVEVSPEGHLLLSIQGEFVQQVLGPAWEAGAPDRPLEASPSVSRLGPRLHELKWSAPGRNLSKPAVVDPSLGFCTYVGSSGPEQGFAFGAVDASGATYLLSLNTSMTPTTPGAFQESAEGLQDLWIAKVSPIGDELEWATFVGGSQTDIVLTGAIDVSDSGSVLVAGFTISPDFPTTAGAEMESTGTPPTNAFGVALELAPDGASLLWSTLWAERVFTQPWSCTFGANNEAIVLYDYCDTCELGFHPPGTPGAFDEQFDLGNSQAVSFDRADGTLKWATYLPMRGDAVDLAPNGDLVIAGPASLEASDPFTPTPGAFQTDRDGSIPAGILRLSSDGSEIRWATMLGPACCLKQASALAVAVGIDGTVLVGGVTGSDVGFPVTPDAVNATAATGPTGYVSKLSADGSSLIWSSMIGGTTPASQSVDLVQFDSAGQAWAAGLTISPDWPTTPDAFQPVFNGPFLSADTTLTKYGPFGETLDYSTYFGATSSGERPIGLGLDPLGRPRLALTNDVAQLPTQPWVYEPNKPGGLDYAVAGFDVPARPWRLLGGGSIAIGSAPNLAGGGDFMSGADVRLSVRAALPQTPVWLVAGLAQIDLPILGGLLIPSPGSLLPATTDDIGGHDWILPWPSPPLPGDVWFQAWCFDPAMPELFSWTNGMRALVTGG